jgi:hypothetical protein
LAWAAVKLELAGGATSTVPEAINKTGSFGPEPAPWPKRTLGNDIKAAQTNPSAIRL